MLQILHFVVALQLFKFGYNPIHLLSVILAVFSPSQDGFKNRRNVYTMKTQSILRPLCTLILQRR